jgi:diguanylate cyclase (GGDEF)-like protein/PAS domain S-box-containing protein
VTDDPTRGMHPLLARQLRRLGLNPRTAGDWTALLHRVSAAYADADLERRILEQSIEVTSDEMTSLYDQLQLRESAVRAIVEAAAEAIISVENDMIITSFNPAAVTMFGWTADEVIGRHVSMLLPAGGTLPVIDDESGAPVTAELTLKHRDGTTFPGLTSIGFRRAGEKIAATLIVRDISERKTFEAELAYQAGHDALTGLPNRAKFHSLLGAALDEAADCDTDVAVLFCDLNRFKIINDSLGHEVGDKVLIEVAARLQSAVRGGDVVARLSGDEFVILCHDVTDISVALKVAERIHTQFAPPMNINGQRIFPSTSVGIAAGAGHTSDEVLRNADMAMYQAKRSGPGNTAVYDDALHEWASHRLDLENGLRRGLKRGELRLHYQPIVRAADGTVERVEALVRWYRPGKGHVSPAEFLAVAAEAGLIRQIDEWVLQLATAQAAQWRIPVPVSINFSSFMFETPGAADLIAAALSTSGLPANRLAIEIPESLMGQSAPTAADSIKEIRALGVHIHLDDFGAAYSTLGRLRDFDLDVIKIDQSFVRSIGDPTSHAIIAAVVGLAHALGLHTVAEGVETREQLDELVRIGCDYIQGYLTAQPLTSQDMQTFVESAGLLPNPPQTAA